MALKNEKGLFIKNPNFWRIPRKKKKRIPKDTLYCYTPTSNKLCPFYNWRKIKDLKPEYLDEEDLIEYGEVRVGYCKLVGCEIEDCCKSCGSRYGIFTLEFVDQWSDGI